MADRNAVLGFISYSCSMEQEFQALNSAAARREHGRCTSGPRPREHTQSGHIIDAPLAPVCTCPNHEPV